MSNSAHAPRHRRCTAILLSIHSQNAPEFCGNVMMFKIHDHEFSRLKRTNLRFALGGRQ
jgi:hypothetical protein